MIWTKKMIIGLGVLSGSGLVVGTTMAISSWYGEIDFKEASALENSIKKLRYSSRNRDVFEELDVDNYVVFDELATITFGIEKDSFEFPDPSSGIVLNVLAKKVLGDDQIFYLITNENGEIVRNFVVEIDEFSYEFDHATIKINATNKLTKTALLEKDFLDFASVGDTIDDDGYRTLDGAYSVELGIDYNELGIDETVKDTYIVKVKKLRSESTLLFRVFKKEVVFDADSENEDETANDGSLTEETVFTMIDEFEVAVTKYGSVSENYFNKFVQIEDTIFNRRGFKNLQYVSSDADGNDTTVIIRSTDRNGVPIADFESEFLYYLGIDYIKYDFLKELPEEYEIVIGKTLHETEIQILLRERTDITTTRSGVSVMNDDATVDTDTDGSDTDGGDTDGGDTDGGDTDGGGESSSVIPEKLLSFRNFMDLVGTIDEEHEAINNPENYSGIVGKFVYLMTELNSTAFTESEFTNANTGGNLVDISNIYGDLGIRYDTGLEDSIKEMVDELELYGFKNIVYEKDAGNKTVLYQFEHELKMFDGFSSTAKTFESNDFVIWNKDN